MDLIYTNSSMQAIGVMKAYDLDLAFGSDENDFEIKVDANNHCCEAGYYVYIIGTEYGGVIDAVTSDTQTGEVTYTGRTWHGILNSKVICPDAGQDYLTLNNEANGVLNSLITRMGLTSIFTVNIYASGLEISHYKMPRYVTGYDGIMQMLKSVGGKLVLSFDGEKVILSAAPIEDHTKDGSVSSDAMSFQVKTTSKKVNHLICLGQGELKDRTVVHLYADASGSISQTQTLTGADEYTAVYDYPSAESAQKLIEAGASRLAELQNQDNLSVSLNEAECAFDVGDVVGAVDTITGISVAVPITKKIVSIRNDYMSVSYETATGKAGTSSSGSSGGIALGGTDHITEQGTTGKWVWRKWSNGTAEMWSVFGTDKLAIDEAWGSLYFGTWMRSDVNVAARKYPFAFVDTPTISVTYMGGGSDAWLISLFSTSDDLLTSAPAYALARPNTATVLKPRISYYVVGKYK